MPFFVSSESSDQSAHLHRLTLAFVTGTESHVLPQMAICHVLWRQQRRLWPVCTFAHAYLNLRHCKKIACAASNGDVSRVITPAAKTLASLHICPRHSNRISCAASNFWRVWTFAQVNLSLYHSNRIACAASNGDLSRVITPAAKTLESLHICTGLP